MTFSTQKLVLFFLLIGFANLANAQVKIGDNPTTINKGSILELESTDKGLLSPRIALTNTTTWSLATGSLPVAGMMVYNTKKVVDGFAGTVAYPVAGADGTGLYYWDGTGWVATKGAAASNDWTILGNTGTSALTNYLGTTDPVDLVFRTTATERMRITADGNIDIPNSSSTTAIITKAGLPFIHNNGNESTAVGVGALNLAATGIRNDAFGYEALRDVTSGFQNTAIGRYSLRMLQSGNDNVAMGNRTLENLISGSGNIGVGRSVMPGLQTGSDNTSIGAGSSLQIKPGASSNTVIGALAGGSLNPGMGIGSSNVLIGFEAGNVHTGDNRLMIDVSSTNAPLIDGDFATRVLTVNNTLKVADLAGVGDRSVVADANGQLKIGGASAVADLRLVTGGHITQDAGVGANGTSVSGSSQIAIGDGAMGGTTSHNNIAIGTSAANTATLGFSNIIMGNNSTNNGTLGYENIVMGTIAATNATGGNYNVMLGPNTGAVNAGDYNVFIGDASGYQTTGNRNTFLGPSAGRNVTSGSNNIVIGFGVANLPNNAGSDQLSIGNWIYGINGKIGLGKPIPTARLHVVKVAADLTPAIIEGCNVYADNVAASAAGVPIGGLYRTATGQLMVRY